MAALSLQRDSSSFISTQSTSNNSQSTQRVDSRAAQIFHGDRQVKARIDSNVPVHEIVNQLVCSPQFNVAEPAALFALRDRADDELITDDNIGARLDRGAVFKLVSSPLIEAAEMVERLATHDDKTVKLATFELKRFVQEPTFMREFVQRGGLVELVGVIEHASGNTLAYALSSMQSLMSAESGWENLDSAFIGKVVHIFCTQSLVNILRPAAAILSKLASYGPQRNPESRNSAISSKSVFTVYSYGFKVLWPLLQSETTFFPSLVQHLSAGDRSLVQESLGLLNALMEGAYEYRSLPFYLGIERQAINVCILRMIEMGASDELVSLIVNFQAHFISMMHYFKTENVDLSHGTYKALVERLETAAVEAKRQATQQGVAFSPSAEPLQVLGLVQDQLEIDFVSVGFLGLKMLVSALTLSKGELTRIMAEQLSRPGGRQWPIGRASNAVTFHLSMIWGITNNDPPQSSPQPLLLNIFRVHLLGVMLFHRLWVDSSATLADFDRISSLVGSQLRLSLRNEKRSIYDLEKDVQNVTYREIRDRQMEELIIEDDLLNKAPVRSLRAKLYQDSYDFVRAQRIACLQQGAWFQHTLVSSFANKDNRKQAPATRWRFYQLAATKRTLHYIETSQMSTTKPPFDSLPNHFDLADVVEIEVPRSKVTSPVSRNPPTSPTGHFDGEKLAFTLYLRDGNHIRMQATDENVYSEWVDGLHMVQPGGRVVTQNTADLIQSLTEIGVRIQLLDLTGERVNIPQEVVVNGVPASRDYHYGPV